MTGDPVGFASDARQEAGKVGSLGEPGVVGEPFVTLGVGDGEAQRAVPELGEVLDDPTTGEEAGEMPDAGRIDEGEIDAVTFDSGEEVAEVEVAVVEAGVVKSRGEFGGGELRREEAGSSDGRQRTRQAAYRGTNRESALRSSAPARVWFGHA